MKRRPSTEPSSERQIAEQYGIPRAVLWRAKQVSNIPEAEFEAMIEGPNPPTVTRLVEIGRQSAGARAPKSRVLQSLKRIWATASPEERAEFVAHILDGGILTPRSS